MYVENYFIRSYENMKKILCIGSVTVDIMVMPASTVPTPGTLRAVESVSTHVGGCATNCANDLAKLGVPVSISCLVGKDMMGDFILKEMSSYGVDCKGIVFSDKVGTTVSVVCIHESGERSFLYNPASSAAFTIDDISDEVLADCDIVFVGGAMLLTNFDGEPTRKLMKRAREMGKITVLDTAWDFDDIWLPKIEACLPELDYFIPSVEEAAKITGEEDPYKIAEKLHTMGPTNIVVKVGKDGALVSPHGEEPTLVPAFLVEHPVDTTGAGDSFCSGFLTGLANDWDMVKAAQFGNGVGAHCVQALGASTGIPSMQTVLDFIAEKTK
jgi:sugar/nucleoside kinase (ribokinase family)